MLSESVQAAIAKYQLGAGGLNDAFISRGSGGWKSKLEVLADGFLPRALSLACRRPPSHHVLTW